MDKHFVYIYRSPRPGGAGKVRYVGYGMSPNRALQHASSSHNPDLLRWLKAGSYELYWAGPYASEEEGRRVEAALIDAIGPDFNRTRSTVFRPVGVPGSIGDRHAQPALTVEEAGALAGGLLLVYLSPDMQLDGRETYDPTAPRDEVVVSNIEEWWAVSPLVEHWRVHPEDRPRVLAGAFGPTTQTRFIVGAAVIDHSIWDASFQRGGDGRWRVPLDMNAGLDAAGLRGRRLQLARFGQFDFQLHIWVDAEGRLRHAPQHPTGTRFQTPLPTDRPRPPSSE